MSLEELPPNLEAQGDLFLARGHTVLPRSGMKHRG